MNTKPIILSFTLLATSAFGQTFDADGNRIAEPVTINPANPELYEVQRRNAGVMNSLVNQTPEYQKGHALRVEAAKQREAAQAAAARREATTSARNPSLSREDQAKIDNLNSDLRRVAEDKKKSLGTKDTESRALRDQQRQIYSSAGITSPVAPEPPPRPIINVQGGTFRDSETGRMLNCHGGVCN